jgi:hypothetical protein
MVMQSADERMGADAADPLNWARDRCIFAQRLVRSGLIIVGGVFAQDPAQVPLAPDDNMVDTLATECLLDRRQSRVCGFHRARLCQ